MRPKPSTPRVLPRSSRRKELPPSKDELKAEISDVDVLIMRVDPKIDKEVLDAAKNLKVIGVCSVGLNHILPIDYFRAAARFHTVLC